MTRASRDLGMLHQPDLDLAQLDAEAADLDLMVGAAGIFDHPVRPAAGEVAGAVEPRAVAVRVGHEALGGQAGLPR